MKFTYNINKLNANGQSILDSTGNLIEIGSNYDIWTPHSVNPYVRNLVYLGQHPHDLNLYCFIFGIIQTCFYMVPGHQPIPLQMKELNKEDLIYLNNI